MFGKLAAKIRKGLAERARAFKLGVALGVTHGTGAYTFLKDNRALAEFDTVAMGLVVVGVTLGLGITVLAKFKNQTTDTQAQNAVGQAISAIGDLAGWLGIVVIVVVAAVILGYLKVMRATDGR